MNGLPQLFKVEILPSAMDCEVTKRISQEYGLKENTPYLALGFLGMQDNIVLVSEKGAVVELPFDEKDFCFY